MRGIVTSLEQLTIISKEGKITLVKPIYNTIEEGTELSPETRKISVNYWGVPKQGCTSERFFDMHPGMVKVYADVPFFLRHHSDNNGDDLGLKPAILLYDKEKLIRGHDNQTVYLPESGLDEIILNAYVLS